MRARTCRFAALLIVGGTLTLSGCQTSSGGAIPAGSATTEAGIGGIQADLSSLSGVLEALKAFVSPPGQPLLAQAQTMAKAATTKTATVQQGVNDTKALTDKQIATLTKQVEDAESHKWLNVILYGLIGFGVVAVAAGVALYAWTKFDWTGYVAMGGGTLAGCAVAVMFTVEVLDRLTPTFVAVGGVCLIVSAIGITGGVLYELYAHRKAIPEVVKDTLTNVQPQVPYTGSTAKLVAATVSATAALPDPIAAHPQQVLQDVAEKLNTLVGK